MSSEQQAILILWQRVNTSLSAFYKLFKFFGSAQQALQATGTDWTDLGIHAKHIERHHHSSKQQDSQFIASILSQQQAGAYQLVFINDERYPAQLKQLFDPPPVLFTRGNVQRLSEPQIAIVGSRKPTSQAQKITFDMAQYLACAGYVITSGLAQGVDAQAHLGALSQPTEQAGRTIGVMGTGIDVCYPKQHGALFERIIAEGGCLISELLPQTPANKHTFPRRNRIVAGLSLGTIVTEAALQSGSLITARLTSEQGKQVFAIPSHIDNKNAEGCLHLIREGATLIYHPDQVIMDLSSQIGSIIGSQFDNQSKHDSNIDKIQQSKSKTSVLTNSKSTTAATMTLETASTLPTTMSVAAHLQPLWVHLTWEGQDLDALITKTQLDTPTLLSQLMELELLGTIEQIGGRYKRL
ncbi:DNA-processing protein DprA [Psychrobacter sp. I-STPA10]|uniref:DNA-processing protein DprA n=1 Tax=Psychrobacter sp. I-STPA10 TaxID=2585769 RepID=UPI001E5F16F0|nr:DNA-processing protein DprA [Psychrobacter sp. I-STPA10]